MKSKAVNEEEVVRVPLAFAMVKLMESLPQDVMEGNLPRYSPLVNIKSDTMHLLPKSSSAG